MLLLVIGIVILSGFKADALYNIKNLDSKTSKYTHTNNEDQDYTHTAFVEVANTQFCGGCDFWNADVYNIYSYGDNDFEYVNMIIYGPDGLDDILNLDAYNWNYMYNITKYPTSIMDGDYQRLYYQPSIFSVYLDECGKRTVKDITVCMTVFWLGNATIKVDIEIKNNEDIAYNGYIRAAITEITSRYNTVYDSKFHFGFLDYVFDKDIFISDHSIYTDSITWNGNEHEDNHGKNFGDIIPGNIQVIIGVYNDDNRYVDETVKAFINDPPYAPTIDGPVTGVAGEEYDYTFVTEDPENYDVLYYIKWGDDTFEDWFGPFKSGETVIMSHKWSKKGRYIIKARAKTINGLMGSWGDFEVLIPRSSISINSLLQWFLERFPFLVRFLSLERG